MSLGQALWRYRLIVLACAAIFMAGGSAIALSLPPTYQATATMFLDTSRNVTDFDLGLQSSELFQHDLIVLATSRPVLLQACTAPGVHCTARDYNDPKRWIGRRVSVSGVKGTTMLAVTAQAPTPLESAALANAVANAVIDQDKAEIARLLSRTKDSLQSELKQLEATIASEKRSRPAPPSPTLSEQRYAIIYGRLLDVTAMQDRLSSIATVLESATPPSKPMSPDPVRYPLAGLIAGVAVGVLAALLAARLDDRVFGPEDLAKAAGTPVVLVAPRASRSRPQLAQQSYALAHANLLARYPQMHALLVAAAANRDDSDAVASGLGAVAAHAGQRVFVVQTNGSPTDIGWPPNGETSGLTTIKLASDETPTTSQAVAEIEKRPDFRTGDGLVVLSVPSPDVSPAALMVARKANRAVLVATLRRTRVSEARRTAELLRQAGVEVAVGVLMPRRAPRKK
jgi:capsular polysaccharide biosynthesis protein